MASQDLTPEALEGFAARINELLSWDATFVRFFPLCGAIFSVLACAHLDGTDNCGLVMRAAAFAACGAAY